MKHSFQASQALLLAALIATGCVSGPQSIGPYTPLGEVTRDTSKAIGLTREAANAIDAGDLDDAEALLREALTADLFHGPAHNNLGVVFLKQDKLYEAAQEFEWAKKLLPSTPDPRVNLALVLESAGREKEALLAWENALAVAPECRQALAGYARLSQLRGMPHKQPSLR